MTATFSRRWMVVLLAAAAGIAGCARSLPPAQRVDLSNVDALQTALGGEKAAGSAVEAGPVAEPTGFASITGTFKLGGPAPPRRPLTVDKEQHVCAPGGRQVLSEELVVDSAGGIKDVVVFLSDKKYKPGDPKWDHPSY